MVRNAIELTRGATLAGRVDPGDWVRAQVEAVRLAAVKRRELLNVAVRRPAGHRRALSCGPEAGTVAF